MQPVVTTTSATAGRPEEATPSDSPAVPSCRMTSTKPNGNDDDDNQGNEIGCIHQKDEQDTIDDIDEPPRGKIRQEATALKSSREEEGSDHHRCGAMLVLNPPRPALREETNGVKAAAAAAATTTALLERRSGDELVTLPREELEAFIDTRVQEGLNREKQEREALFESRVESMVRSILKNTGNDNGQEQDKYPTPVERFACEPHPQDNIELKELVSSSSSSSSSNNNNNNLTNRQQNQEEKEQEWYSPFGESVYTLLYMCPFKSQGFWFGVFVYYLQIATIGLTMADAVDEESKTNPLQLPPMVDFPVTYAQSVTLLLMFAYQSDLIEAVLKLGDGYYPELLQEYPGATFSTWLFSCLAQLGAGLLVLLASFILTMQASTVVGLMLNLTALLFISEIDDVGFFMAKYGFVTNTLQAATYKAMELKVPKRKSRNCYRRVLCLITTLALYGGFYLLKHRQFNGYYLSTNIYVQFGDSFNPIIAHYSGIFTAGTKTTTHQGYRDYRDIGTSNILLSYCLAERAWTFCYATGDPCNDYFAISYETTTYDVTTIPDSEWQVKDSYGRLQPFDSFSLVDRDCNPKICQGTCESDGLCHCSHDRFGLDCEFFDLCQTMTLDDRFPGFPQVLSPSVSDPKELESTAFSRKFELLRNHITNEYLRIYNMPIYYSNSSFPANIIFFGGRRWILTTEAVLFDLMEARDENPDRWYFPEKTIEVLEDGFHSHYLAKYTPFFMSTPVDFETPEFQPTPIGIPWWTVKNTNPELRHFVPDTPVEAVLVCGDAPPPSCLKEPESYCGPNGYCNTKTGLCVCCELFRDCDKETGYCNCLDEGFYYGDRCELVKPCYDQMHPCNDGRGNCDETSGVCNCNLPWHGQACLALHKCFEDDGRCMNAGECNITSGSCNCPADPAITGEACEETADCLEFGCANGGVCGWTGECVCQPPYHGAHCDLIDKTQESYFCFSDDDCMDGTCNVDTGLCDCNGPSTYGPLCEHTFNCSYSPGKGRVPCLNEGTCNEKSGVCDCPEPYFGPDCSQAPPCRTDPDCWGPYQIDWYGTCDVESGLCQCKWGKRGGMVCEKDRFLCHSDSDCYGLGSTCSRGICSCESGRGGRHCYSYIGTEYLPYQLEFQQLVEESVKLCGFDDPMCCFQNETGFHELKYHRC